MSRRHEHSQGQGIREDDLPPACGGDAKKYYVEMDYIWSLLEDRQVVLVHGSWLLGRSADQPFSALECRQDLPDEAAVDTQQLRAHHSRNSEHGQPLMGYTSIIAISHCWLTSDHPDPEGHLLKEIAPFVRLRNKAPKDMYVGYFFAWCSLYQPYHGKQNGKYRRLQNSPLTEDQEAAFRKSLECVDIWYAHAQTQVWMLTKYFPWQGDPYDDRGWPTWERTVSQILGSRSCVLDLGKIDASKYDWFSYLIIEGNENERSFPMLPSEFDTVIEGKRFTAGRIDCQLIKQNYRRNFSAALGCCEALCCGNIKWRGKDFKDFVVIIDVLKSTKSLRRLELGGGAGLGDAGARAVGIGIRHCKQLENLLLQNNRIGNVGARALADGLELCSELELILLDGNQIGDSGASYLMDRLQHCNKLTYLGLVRNQISDVGKNAIEQMCKHRSQLMEVRLDPDNLFNPRWLMLAALFVVAVWIARTSGMQGLTVVVLINSILWFMGAFT